MIGHRHSAVPFFLSETYQFLGRKSTVGMGGMNMQIGKLLFQLNHLPLIYHYTAFTGKIN